MPPYLSPLHLVKPSLPPHCEPQNAFLYWLSSISHSCVPTNLAFLSTLLGTLSIVSWLFAQLPQIYKNHKLKSTSGLSIYFLGEWLLGDVSNLLGSVFTHQALWQVIIAGYYVSVDCMLVGQWVWYALLKHGRPLRPARDAVNRGNGHAGGGGSMAEVLDGVSIGGSAASSPTKPTHGQQDKKGSAKKGKSVDVPHRSNPMDVFRIPNFARSPSTKEGESSTSNSPQPGTTPNRNLMPPTRVSNSPMPSPRTVIYLTLILSILSTHTSAKPLSPFTPTPFQNLSASSRTPPHIYTTTSSPTPTEKAGTLLSWLSTFLYLGSRLPQLYKNWTRRSTSGLSSSLFLAAFFGNLFYSTSLLANPCAWNDFGPGEGYGWVGSDGSNRAQWVSRAVPFFLGAAGVLGMDAGVGVQFWLFGENTKRISQQKQRDEVSDESERGRKIRRESEDSIILPTSTAPLDIPNRPWKWHRASGWMRGWVPSVSVAGTPSFTPIQTPRRGGSPVSSSSSAASARSIPRSGSGVGIARGVLGRSPNSLGGIGGSPGALEEARALLGTSPRRNGNNGGGYGYGGVS